MQSVAARATPYLGPNQVSTGQPEGLLNVTNCGTDRRHPAIAADDLPPPFQRDPESIGHCSAVSLSKSGIRTRHPY